MEQQNFKNSMKERVNQGFLYPAKLSFKNQGYRKTVFNAKNLRNSVLICLFEETIRGVLK